MLLVSFVCGGYRLAPLGRALRASSFTRYIILNTFAVDSIASQCVINVICITSSGIHASADLLCQAAFTRRCQAYSQRPGEGTRLSANTGVRPGRHFAAHLSYTPCHTPLNTVVLGSTGILSELPARRPTISCTIYKPVHAHLTIA